MTKRHFEHAAKYVRELGNCNLHGHDQCNRCAAMEAFVELFREFGPNFDELRFRNACAGIDATDWAGRRVRYSEEER